MEWEIPYGRGTTWEYGPGVNGLVKVEVKRWRQGEGWKVMKPRSVNQPANEMRDVMKENAEKEKAETTEARSSRE